MREPLITFLLLLIFAHFSYSQTPIQNIKINKTIEQNEELEIPLNNNLQRVEINFQNVVDKESIAFWTSFQNGVENPENKIGPKKYRTIKLSPQINNEDEKIKLDKKTIVLNTDNADKIIIRVEQGKVNIQIKSPKKRM